MLKMFLWESEDVEVDSHEMSQKELRISAEKNLGETPHKRKRALKELREWLKSDENKKRLSCVKDLSNDEFLLKFIRMQKTDAKNASVVLENYVRMRTNNPGWFRSLDIQEPRLNEIFSSGYLFVLPRPDANGRRVIFSRPIGLDTAKFTADDVMRAHMITYEALAMDEDCQINGVTYLFDEKGINWSHVAMWTPSEVTKAFGCAERAIPIRHQEVNLINLPWGMTLVFRFAKSLLSSKLRQRVQTCSSFKEVTKRVPVDILPAEYGGEVPMQTMIDDWKKVLETKRDAILELDSIRYQNVCDQNMSSSTVTPASCDGMLEVVGTARNVEMQQNS